MLSITNISLGSQPKDSIPIIHFQITDATNGKPVSLAHVYTRNDKKGVITDMLGYFKIPLTDNDTLTISALGYHNMHIPSWGQFSPDSLYYPIRLTPRSYEINEVRITRFGSYQRFLKEVASMEIKKSETEKLQEKLENYIRKNITRMKLTNTPSGGITFGKDWFAKQQELIEEKQIEDKRWNLILRKFSAKTVNELTGLEGIEAIRFMEYCNFTEGFLLLSSDYEIRKRIVDKYEEYQEQKHLKQ